MPQVFDSKEDVAKTYNDIDEVEENLYIEFQNTVHDLSKEITNNVMASIVSTPLDEIYKKYESQLPRIESSTEKIHNVSEQIQETKKDLYENISEIISEVSNKTIEDTVFTKLETIKNEYERQIPLLDKNSNELQELIEELKKTKADLYQSTQAIISEVSSKVIKEEVLLKFDELFRQHEIQLPKIKETSNQMEQLINKIEETRQQLYSNVSSVYNAMSNRIIDTVNEKLTVIYEKYNKRVEDLDQKHKSLQKVNTDLNNTKEELLDTIRNYKSEIEALKKDIESLQKDSNILARSLKEKFDYQNKIMIGVGIAVAISLFI